MAGQSPSTAVNIPQRLREGDTSTFTGGDASIVGSPGQLPPPSLDSPSPLLPAWSQHRTPASLAATSHSGTSSTRRISLAGPSRTVRRVASRVFRVSEGAESQNREWTLFGQRMENEGQLRAPEASSLKRKPSLSLGGLAEPQTLEPITSAAATPTRLSRGQSPEAEPVSPRSDASNPRLGGASIQEDAPDYNSDQSDDTSHSRTHSSRSVPSRRVHWLGIPELTSVQKNILKCAVAYFIGSLFTFNSHLSKFVANLTSDTGIPSQTGHMVATVAVYFNPAKTAGGMVEADTYCIMGLVFAAFVCLSSTSTYWWLELKPGWEWLADVLIIFWVGLGMSGVAWVKLWMDKPTFNPACSMVAIILFTVIVKEGGLWTLLDVAILVSCGAIIANLVCFMIWPQSATVNLRNNMTKTLDSFSTLLNMITNTFLLEEPLHQPSQEKIQRAAETHQASFTSLKKSLAEARSEAIFGGPSKPGRMGGRKSLGQAYEDAIDSLNRLGQHLNGLRSGTRLQYDLTKAHLDGKLSTKRGHAENGAKPKRAADGVNGKCQVPSNDAAPLEGDPEENALLQEAARMFGDLVDDLGPPLRALSTTCTLSIRHLREALTSKGRAFQPQEFDEVANDIERALFTFESTSNHAVLRLYRKNPTSSELPDQPSVRSMNSLEENHFLDINEYENLFLVYFFIFTLQEFATELHSLVDAMGRICMIEQAALARGSWWKRNVVVLVKRIKFRFATLGRGSRPQNRRTNTGVKRPISTYFLPDKMFSQTSWFPKVKPHAPNTIQTPARSQLSFFGRLKQSLWALGSRLRERDSKYAFKAGMATALLAAPAFFDRTRPIFMEYRGEWALISFFVVISPTIGATNNLSINRVLGTLVGATTAATVYSLFPENPYVLSIFGFFFSIPCFYFIVALPQHATSGRFVLLTYNLTCLFCYNLRQRDLSVVEVAFKRSVAVIAGVVYAFIVSRVWWPSEARRELGTALGEFCLNIGWLYTRLVAHNSFAPEVLEILEDEDRDEPANEHDRLVAHAARTKLNNSIQEFMAMELHLQIKLIELQGLLSQTQHEPRLKGPFPVKLYRNILTSLQTILDRLHSMRCVTTREEWYTNVRRDFILPVNKQRHDMVGNIILYFSILSSAFRLKAPLPPYLPPAEAARQRLVDAIRELDVVKNRDVRGSRQLLFFAYALTMKGVTQELDSLGKTLQDAFGVIGQTAAEFDALFVQAGQPV